MAASATTAPAPAQTALPRSPPGAAVPGRAPPGAWKPFRARAHGPPPGREGRIRLARVVPGPPGQRAPPRASGEPNPHRTSPRSRSEARATSRELNPLPPPARTLTPAPEACLCSALRRPPPARSRPNPQRLSWDVTMGPLLVGAALGLLAGDRCPLNASHTALIDPGPAKKFLLLRFLVSPSFRVSLSLARPSVQTQSLEPKVHTANENSFPQVVGPARGR